MLEKVFPYLLVLASTFTLTLLITPIVRELNRRLGMVDRPDPRRINKTPIPRGGGIAIVLGVMIPYVIFHFYTGRPWLYGVSDAVSYRMVVLSCSVALLGLIDDKMSLRPKIKLLGQIAIASLAWGWAGLGFSALWPSLPPWIDCVLTVFWIVGAVNAFNLIDGLDGLASGLALIAVIGMAGSLFFSGNSQATLFYFAIAGGLLGFLRYNYHPASVFLGDAGSMFIGFLVATLPLASQLPNSFLVSVGVPLLSMGVPIFDTSLAILRRSIRHLLSKGNHASEGKVMSADSDHLHHRILRATGLNQRKTAWTLYSIAALGVATGLIAMSLQSRAAGLWLLAIAVAAVVVFKDASIELFDAGRLLNSMAHTRDINSRRRLARLQIPFYLVFDLLSLTFIFLICMKAFRLPIGVRDWHVSLPIRVFSVFFCLVFFKVYVTSWSRAMASNYVRLAVACILGTLIGSVMIYYVPGIYPSMLYSFTIAYAALSVLVLGFVRTFRGLVRDLFYAVDCARLKTRKDVSRILVYGAGLRYRAFRRELVRTTSANDRMIVGVIDDDLLLRGKYIGGIRIHGTINEAPEIINALNIDAVVIACDISDEWLSVVKKILSPTGVKVSRFSFSEQPI